MLKIKIIIMDVDGTLTDGKINMGNSGEIFKSFDVKDGYAIKHILPENNIIPMIITGRKSQITENRAKEIGIQEIYQGIENKLELLENICDKHNIKPVNIAYIGDDLNDLGIMQVVGIAACPANASVQVKNISKYISDKNGGDGAVRDFIEWIVKNNEIL